MGCTDARTENTTRFGQGDVREVHEDHQAVDVEEGEDTDKDVRVVHVDELALVCELQQVRHLKLQP